MEPTSAPTRAEADETEAGASDGAEPELIEVRRPADGSLIRTVEIDSAEKVAETAARLRSNQAEWEALGIEGRYRWLGQLRDYLLDNREEIGDVLQEETGKVRADATLEAPYVAGVINFYGENAAEFLAEERLKSKTMLTRSKRMRTAYRPYELVGAISPWNFPIILGLEDSIAAMTAGSAALLKPSDFTPLAVMKIVDAWKYEIGGPDVIDYVNGRVPTGEAVVDNVDFIQFTGSERGGKGVMKRAAETLTPVSLELGGKDPMIVLADADLDRAANAATWGGFANTGQICISVERVYVEEPIYDEFVAKMKANVEELNQGADGRDYGAEVGAMTSPNQIAIVEDHVEDARKAGARILTGGQRLDKEGDWYPPTLIVDADPSMKVMNEETFGPVVPVMKVKDSEEALRLANDSTYGLSGSVFTKDVARGEALARRMDMGSINVNDALFNYFAVETPMGGWKNSGIGYRHGAYGIRKFVRTASIVSPAIPTLSSEPTWFPYTKRRRDFVARLFRALNARGLKDRLGIGK